MNVGEVTDSYEDGEGERPIKTEAKDEDYEDEQVYCSSVTNKLIISTKTRNIWYSLKNDKNGFID